MLLLTLQRYTWLWAAARGGQEDRKEQGPRRGTVAASFHVYFPLKLSFNVSITLFFQKINIGIEKKTGPLNLSANRYHRGSLALY